ncbi:MAG: hypothetical protein JXQ83_08635 [Candidatus Glassbacteria bacterium]|nr:hypothetical protein [Candidatus Glassbacteria bacterium]
MDPNWYHPYRKLLQIPAAVFPAVLLLGLGCVAGPPARGKPLDGIKVICVWTVEAKDPQAVDRAVEQADSLGFNAVCWDRPGVPEACHERGMKAFSLVNPLDLREGAQPQVLEPGEELLPGYDGGDIPPAQLYQYGGEPVKGHREILDQNLTCPNDPGVLEYTLKRMAQMQERGFDGVIWDFIGYRNYHSCECGLCRQRLAEFSAGHPELGQEQARSIFYEQVLVDLYNTLYREAKVRAPELIIANHIHPVFLPDIFYGHKVRVDYAGITVSWFFTPHWLLGKVRNYTGKVVGGPYVFKEVEGMPMIGFYADGEYARDRKNAQRLEQEFGILRKSGARHLIMCELGHILRDKGAAGVVRRELAGE